MYVVMIESGTCEGCGECVNACPARILSMEDGKAEVTGNTDECLGCESCVSICPSGSVTLQEY
jgi:NAD-dependent dihydropyrimidine dehydrogenase PreA subunit